MRGKHVKVILCSTIRVGSSPHARGAPPPLHAPDPGRGIIPACAGSTCWRARCRCSCRDHPRMRGEHYLDGSTDRRLTGSSPHARGALGGPVDAVVVGVIIPACAGSTSCPSTTASCTRDHPRMRGEHEEHGLYRWGVLGSSPHARGARFYHFMNGDGVGIIPACAGSTTARIGSRCAGWDHPRMRGEHFDQIDSQSERGGSSPHARGARAKLIRVLVGRRIIPACAGSTPTTPGTACPTGDHPRMRGEHCFAC